MQWYIFGEAERRNPAPAFRLQSGAGTWIARDDFRGMANLVLYFPATAECQKPCRDAMWGFIANRSLYRAEMAQVLSILSAPAGVVARLQEQLEPAVTLLADPLGQARHAYANLIEEEPGDEDMLFVLDRFGAPLVALAEGDAADPAIHEEIADWLTYAEIKCPE